MLFLWVGVLCIICMFVAVCSSRCARNFTLFWNRHAIGCYSNNIVLVWVPIKFSSRWIAGKVAQIWLHVESGCFMKFNRHTAGVIFIQMMHFMKFNRHTAGVIFIQLMHFYWMIFETVKIGYNSLLVQYIVSINLLL